MPPQIQTLQGLWVQFREKSGLNTAPTHQRYEMEYAFKCGSIALLMEQRNNLSQLTEEDGMAVLNAWAYEFSVFIQDRIRRFNAGQNN